MQRFPVLDHLLKHLESITHLAQSRAKRNDAVCLLPIWPSDTERTQGGACSLDRPGELPVSTCLETSPEQPSEKALTLTISTVHRFGKRLQVGGRAIPD